MRKTKIVCTMGPKCWDEESMGKLIDADMGVARSTSRTGHTRLTREVLDRFRKVCEEKKAHCAVLLDTKGPEIRRRHAQGPSAIELEAGPGHHRPLPPPDPMSTPVGGVQDPRGDQDRVLLRQAVPERPAWQPAAVR